MKKQGFTLIELLAVIVILAIIALIATPIILGVIEDSKKKAVENTAYGLISSAKQTIARAQLNNQEIPNVLNYNFDGHTLPTDQEITLSFQGSIPESGYLKVYSDGSAELAVQEGNHCVVKTKANEKVEVLNSDCQFQSISDLILTKFPNLVLGSNGCKTAGSDRYSYMGGCYLKGTQTENYIWYQGFLWRIMGVNADQSIRLIVEENLSAFIWGAPNESLNYDQSYLKKWLNEQFGKETGLLTNSNIVPQTWCSEVTTNLASARTTCTNNLSTGKAAIGTISIDEYNLSGGKDGYLKTNQRFWSITPGSASSILQVMSAGTVISEVQSWSRGVRPIVNVSSDTVVTAGNGQLNSNWSKDASPYIVENLGIAGFNTIGGLHQLGKIGEYVKMKDLLYRIQGIEGSTIKLLLDRPIETVTYPEALASLENGHFIQVLLKGDTKLESYLKKDYTWYQGTEWGYSITDYDYERSLNNRENPLVGPVGYLRIGEILQAQSVTQLTTGFTKPNSYNNVLPYWSLTPYIELHNWYMNIEGYMNGGKHEVTYGVRPILAMEKLPIDGGNGTPTNPYIVK